jgi:hypothetical protein
LAAAVSVSAVQLLSEAEEFDGFASIAKED